jgi:hypothetical protein
VSAGTFTFTPAVTGIASTAVGIDFILGNKDGEGFSHDEVMDAITTAIRRRRAPRRVRDQVLLTTTTGTYEYGVPANWLGVDAVEYQPWSGWPTDWQPIAQPYAPYSATTGILTLLVPPPNNALRITGRALPQLPALLTDLVPGDGAAIRDDAVFELLKMSDDPGDRQRAAMMQGGVERARAGAALARAVRRRNPVLSSGSSLSMATITPPCREEPPRNSIAPPGRGIPGPSRCKEPDGRDQTPQQARPARRRHRERTAR